MMQENPAMSKDDGVKARHVAQDIKSSVGEGPKSVPGYRFQDPAYLREALSHPSLARGSNYQRLEFLGDRVLGLVIAETLFYQYPEEAEGRLNRRYSALVRRETLAEITVATGIDRLISMTQSADFEGTRCKPSVLGDVGEAVIGAVYLDGGFAEAKSYILKHWKPYLEEKATVTKDAKTALQEWAQGRGLALPVYTLLSRSGPDHQPRFKIRVSLGDVAHMEAEARSKRLAEQQAAKKLLEKLEAVNG